MRKSEAAVAMLVLCVCTVGMAQDSAKGEIFGGYQYTRINPGGGVTGNNFNGWNAAVTGYIKPNLGLTGDIGGAYRSVSGVSLKSHTFLFGPTLAVNSGKARPFVHGLFGIMHASAGLGGSTASDNAFAAALGGGVDLSFSPTVSVRLGQFDYLMSRFGSTTQNNFRFSAGVVLRVGKG